MSSLGQRNSIRRARRPLPRRPTRARHFAAATTYLGVRPQRPLFLRRRTQHVSAGSGLDDWLGGIAMLLAATSGSLLLALLAS
jgi:hypothetical protein